MPLGQDANWEPSEWITQSKDSHVMTSDGTTRYGRENGTGVL